MANLLLYWPLDANATDSSGNNRNGSYLGSPTFSTGKIGNAIVLSGSSQGVNIANDTWMPTGNAAKTLALWFKTSSVGTDYYDLGGWGSGAGGTPLFFLFVKGHKLYTETGSGANTITSSADVNDNAWHHAALTYDGSVLRMYLDGTLINAVTCSINTAASDFRIGYGQFTSSYFAGSIDDVRIYDAALSQGDITALQTNIQFQIIQAKGGGIAGGQATVVSRLAGVQVISSGGAVVGGSAVIFNHYGFASFAGSGGAVAGGNALVTTGIEFFITLSFRFTEFSDQTLFRVPIVIPLAKLTIEFAFTEKKDTTNFTSIIPITISLAFTETKDITQATVFITQTIAFAFSETIDQTGFLVTLLPAIVFDFTETSDSSYFVLSQVSGKRVIVLNTLNNGLSEYDNYNMDSIVELNGLYYGLTDTAVYLLSGDDDAGESIQTVVETGITDHQESRLKSVPNLYIGGDFNGSFTVETITDTEISVLNVPNLAPDTSSNISKIRVKLSLGSMSRYWGFRLSNSEGTTLNINSIEYSPTLSKRRM